MLRRRIRAAAAAGLAVAVLAACDGTGLTAPSVTPTASPHAGSPASGPDATPRASPRPDRPAGGTLRIGIGEPRSLVPFDAVEPDDLVVVDAVFDSLTRYERNFVVTPAAARSWSHEDDAATWTFSLREGAVFHDGTPVTAADFAFAWETAVRTGSAGFHLRDVQGYQELRRGAAGRLAGVEVVDARTLRVRLSQPRAEFPAVVAHPALGPVPRDRYLEDREAYAEQPVGNGPFALAEAWVPGQFIRLQRASEWHNDPDPVTLDEVLFQVMDSETAFVAFQQGRLQVSPLPDGALDAAVEQFGESPDGYSGPGVLQGTTPVLYFFAFDVTQPPFDDADVRRAISLAINRDAIVERLEDVPVQPADSLVPPVFGGQDGSCEACRYDPEAARDLLAGREPLESITLWFNRDAGHRPVAEQVRADLSAVGIGPVVLRSPPFGEYLEVLEAGEAGLFRFGWRPEYPIADDLLYPLFHSSRIGEQNYMRYAVDEVDALLDEARASLGLARRRFLLRQAEDRIINGDQAIVPVMRYRHNRVVSEDVSGLRIDPMGSMNLHEVRLDPG